MAFWNNPPDLFPKQQHRWVISFGASADQNLPHYFAKSVSKPSYEIGTVKAKYLYAHTFNFPSRLIWKPIKLDLYDVYITNQGEFYEPIIRGHIGRTSEGTVKKQITPGLDPDLKKANVSTQLFFYKFLQESGYFDPNELESDDQILRFRSYHFKKNMTMALTNQKVDLLKNSSEDYSKDYMSIKELDGEGNVIETWNIFNPIITNVTFGNLSYESGELVNMTADITYDWAELIPVMYKDAAKPVVQDNKPPELSKQKQKEIDDLYNKAEQTQVVGRKEQEPPRGVDVYIKESQEFQNYRAGQIYIPRQGSDIE